MPNDVYLPCSANGPKLIRNQKRTRHNVPNKRDMFSEPGMMDGFDLRPTQSSENTSLLDTLCRACAFLISD